MAKNQRLNATITIGSVLDKSIGKHFRVIRNGLDNVGNEIKTVTDRQKELSKQRRVLEKQGKSVDALDREYEELGRTLDKLRRKQERFERAQKAANRVGRDFGAATRNIGRFARNTAIVAGAASAAIFGLASSTAQLGDDVAKKADSLGIGIETFQELRFAAERSGIATSQFDSNMVAFTKRMGEAAQGSGPAIDALEALGIKIGDIKDLAPEEQLAMIADRLKGIESPAERAAIMADLFSRSGVNMVNMLRHGSEELRTLMSDARATGFVLSEEAARDAEKFQDRLLETRLVAQGLKNTIGAKLMPVVTDMMIDFGQFMRNNRDDVEAFAKNLANGLRDAVPVIGKVATGVADIGGTIATGIGKLAEFVGGWKNFGIILGGVMASKAVLSVGSLVVSVVRLGWAMWGLLPGTGAAMAGLGALAGMMKGKALGAAMKLRGGLALVTGAAKTLGRALLLNPVGLAIAVIAAGAYLIRENWEDIAEWFGDLWDNVTDIFGGFGDFVGGVWRGDMDAAADGLGKAWDGAKGVLGNVLDGIGGVFKATWNDLIKPVTDKFGVTDEIEAAWGAASDRIGSAVDAIGQRFGGPLRQAFEGYRQYVTGVWRGDMDAAAEGLGDVWEAAKGIVGAALDGMGSRFKSAWTDGIKPITDKMGVTDEIEAAWGATSDRIGSAVDAIGQRFGGPLRQAFEGYKQYVTGVWRGDMDAAAEGLGDVWEAAKGIVGAALDGMGSRFKSAWTDGIKPITDKMGVTDEIEAAWGAASDRIGSAVDAIGERFGGPLRQAFEGLGQYVSGAWAEDMSPAELEAAWQAREELLNRSLDRLKSGFKGLGAFVGDVFTGDLESAAEKVGSAWDGTKEFLGRTLDGMGVFFGEVWENSIKPVTDKLGVTDMIVSAWETVKSSLEAILNWIGEKFDWVLEKISPVIDGLKWVKEKAGSIGGAIGGALPDFAAARARDKGNFPGPPRDRATGKVQERAVGGTFAANIPLLVGEDGPELSYPSQGGFIAHNRALERMKSISAEIVGRVRQLGDLAPGVGTAMSPIAVPARAPEGEIGARTTGGGGRLAAASGVLATSLSALPAAASPDGGPGAAIARALTQVVNVAAPEGGRDAGAMPGGDMAATVERIIERVAQPAELPRRPSESGHRQAAQITQTITINAPQGMDVEALVEEIERRRRQAQNDALFDRATDYGQYGEG